MSNHKTSVVFLAGIIGCFSAACSVDSEAWTDEKISTGNAEVTFWDEDDGATYTYYAAPRHVDLEESTSKSADTGGVENLVMYCCKANCRNGTCKVPGGADDCSCGCNEGGYPTCGSNAVGDANE